MKEESIISKKSYSFALRIVALYKYLIDEKHEFVLSKQVLKSGASIGANVEEANGAQSRADFVAKLNIAYKEGRETKYWLRLLYDGGFIEEHQFNDIAENCIELNRILARIIISSKST